MVTEPRETPKFDYGLDFQRKLLRVLYTDQDFTCTTGVHLSHEHFEKPAYRWLAQKIITYAQKHGSGISPDAISIEMARDLKTGRLSKAIRAEAEALIVGLDKKVKDRSYVKQELFKFIKHQAIRRAMLNIVDGGLYSSQDYEAIDAEMASVLSVQESLSGGLGHFFMRDRKLRMKRRGAYVRDGVPTGLRVDDHLKPGGLPRRGHHLTTVIAPSGIGKSHILVYIGRSAIVESLDRPTPVLYVSTELSEEAVGDRFDAALSGVAVGSLEKRRKTVSRTIRDLGLKIGEFLVIKEFPEATMTAGGLRAYIRQLERAAFYPGLVIVDSADDFEPEHHGRDRDSYNDYGVVWSGMRRVSHEVGAPFVTASQTQRDALNKEFVDWDKTSDSAKKIHKSDLALIFQQTLEEKKRKRGRLNVAKNRLGPDKFDLPVRVDWSRSMITNI